MSEQAAVALDWNEETCRRYAQGIRRLVRYDHVPLAACIANRVGSLRPDQTVAEIAAGSGHLLLELGRRTKAALVAVDAEPAMLRLAAKEAQHAKLALRTVKSRADQLDLPDASVDVVVCKNLLNCLPKDESRRAVIRELGRVLVPGGKAFVVDFDREASRLCAWFIRGVVRVASGPDFARDFWAAQERRFDVRAVEAWMTEFGFEALGRGTHGISFVLEGTKVPSLATPRSTRAA